jgi:glucose-1-phosphate thymidylyltransferase
MINKVVILARGLGTRMRAANRAVALDQKQTEVAEQGIKTLIPIVGQKTLLDFIFENLSKAGFSEVCLVIGPEHQAIRNFCQKLNYNISFAIQEKPLGTADAVSAAKQFAGNQNFVVLNSDNLYPVKDLKKLGSLNQAGLVAFDKNNLITNSNISEEKINKFAIIEFDENDYLTKIVEKPEKPITSSLISMNAWAFSPKIFEACQNITLSARGEFELADAVNYAISILGEKFKGIFSNGAVLDLSSREDIESLAKSLIENE